MKLQLLLRLVTCAIIAAVLCGCSSIIKDMPPGTNIQISTTGFRVAPQAVDGPIMLGQSTVSLQTPSPPDAGPSLNRNQVRAGLTGVDVTSTVATGPVGEQIDAAGGPLALEQLLKSHTPGDAGTVPTTPVNQSRDADQ